MVIQQRQPWTTEADAAWFVVLDADRRLVARTATEENARLFATAPELLEAAQLALGYLGAGRIANQVGMAIKCDQAVEVLRAAVAKARGT